MITAKSMVSEIYFSLQATWIPCEAKCRESKRNREMTAVAASASGRKKKNREMKSDADRLTAGF